MDYFFVRRPIVAMVIAVVIIIVGLISLRTLPTEQYPDITPPVVSVKANYTGANAMSVEQSVATPLEQQINGVEKMIYMKSTNSNDGQMTINVSFDVGTDPDMNTVFTQNRVASATAKLPEEVKRTGVTTEKSMPNMMMLIALTSEGDRYDQDFLGNYALINIKDMLARITGIGRVDVMGASDYSMRIWIRPDRLAQLGITVPEIVDAIKAQSVIVPGGRFGAEPAPPGTEFTYTVKLPDRLQTEEEFGDIVVRTSDSGAQVKIRDLARVELGVESYLAFTRMNGQECAMIALYQAPGSNAVQLAEQVRAAMETMTRSFPEGIRYDISFDSTQAITAGIDEIIVTLLIALVLVILVVFVFIQDWRATLIPTVAIPVSLIGAFIVFPMLGFTINVLSLLGLVLAIGIVVDDAIVVTEAVQVNIEKGMDAKEATNKAIREVMAPVIATTLVLVAVFLPTVGIAGITGRLYQQFAITVTISVLFSSLNALTLSPALCSILLRKSKPYGGPLGKFFTWFEKVYEKSSGSYMGLTNILTRRIKRGVAFIGIAIIAMVILGIVLPTGFMPDEDLGYLFINMQLPDAASLQRSDAVMKKVEETLKKYEEVSYYTTATGYSMLSGTMSTNGGFVAVSLREWSDRDRTANEIIRSLNREFSAGFKEGQVFAFGPPPIPGLGNGSGFSMMVQDRGGNTPEYLSLQTAGLIRELTQRPEIGSAFTTFRAAVPQRFLEIDRDKVLQSGVSLNNVYTTIGAFLGGAYVNDFNRFGRLYKTYIQAEPEFRQDADKMDLFFVRNDAGDQRSSVSVRKYPRIDRAGLCEQVQPFQVDRGKGEQRARILIGTGYGSHRRGRCEGTPLGYGSGVDRHVVPGEEGFRDRGCRLCLFTDLCLPYPGRAVRELVSASEHPAGDSVRNPGCLPSALRCEAFQRELSVQRFRPDLAGDAYRHGREERDPHRGIRENRIRRGAFPLRRCHQVGEAAVQADTYDSILVHPGHNAADICLRCRSGSEEGHGHVLVRRHVVGDRARGLLLPDAFRSDRAPGGV